MTRQEKAERIQILLEDLFPDPDIPLNHQNNFTFLIAVLLSAPTTDKKVIEVTPKLFRLANTPQKMVKVPQKKVLETIRQLGLAPQKAKAIKELSDKLVEEFDSKVPQDFEALESLPGVGHKTASVVMAQAFGVPAFPVDTHIHRLANRWGLSNGKSVTQTEKDLKKLFPRDAWNALHLQIIYFGRAHCPARYHDLKTCPICSWAASQKQIQAEQKMNQKGSAKKRKSGGVKS